jgi:hypothetical protein
MAIKQLLGEQKFSEIDEELRKIVERRKTRIKVVGCGDAEIIQSLDLCK